MARPIMQKQDEETRPARSWFTSTPSRSLLKYTCEKKLGTY